MCTVSLHKQCLVSIQIYFVVIFQLDPLSNCSENWLFYTGLQCLKGLMALRVFEPVGMVDSVMVYEADRDNIELATPYELDGDEPREVNLAAQIALNAYLGVSGWYCCYQHKQLYVTMKGKPQKPKILEG